MSRNTTVLKDTVRLYKRHKRTVKLVWKVLVAFSVLVSLLQFAQLFVGDKFVLIERIHETVHDVNLDLTNATTHPSATMKFTVSATVTVERVNGTTEVLSGG